LPSQPLKVAGIFAGYIQEKSPFSEEIKPSYVTSLLAVKDVVNLVSNFKKCAVQETMNSTKDFSLFHPFRSASFVLDGEQIGIAGEISQKISKELGFQGRISAFEVNLTALLAKKDNDFSVAKPVSLFPPATEDFSFVVDSDLKLHKIIDSINKVAKDLIEKIVVSDIYRDASFGDNKKSITISVKLRPSDRTFNRISIGEIRAKIIESVESENNAKLRKQHSERNS
jgi:phenylalanyl-tRNA synthetase beta chain